MATKRKKKELPPADAAVAKIKVLLRDLPDNSPLRVQLKRTLAAAQRLQGQRSRLDEAVWHCKGWNWEGKHVPCSTTAPAKDPEVWTKDRRTLRGYLDRCKRCTYACSVAYAKRRRLLRQGLGTPEEVAEQALRDQRSLARQEERAALLLRLAEGLTRKTQTCSGCGLVKPLDMFPTLPSGRLRARCKTCRAGETQACRERRGKKGGKR